MGFGASNFVVHVFAELIGGRLGGVLVAFERRRNLSVATERTRIIREPLARNGVALIFLDATERSG